MSAEPDWDRIYRSTTYTATVPLRLRVGEMNPLLDAVLESVGCETYGYLTAWNPDSQMLPASENHARQRQLTERLRDMGLDVYVGAGVADDGASGFGVDGSQAVQRACRGSGIVAEDSPNLALPLGAGLT